MSASVRTTCPYCGVGCGLIAQIDDAGVVSVKGDPDHPANRGRLCSKGSALGETVYLEDRLLYPEAHGEQVSWEQAIAEVAGEFSKTIEKHGPDSVAFYVSGQLLTEDYYVANKLMKGCIGSGNIDTNSRLCMSSPVAAYKRAFGEDCVPVCYDDLDAAELIVIAGSNTAWCHPVVYQRIVKAKKDNPDLKVVLIDPRRTQTAGIADLHLAIEPGTDAILWNGLLLALEDGGARAKEFTKDCTSGLDKALSAARESAPNLESVADTCGLPEPDVAEFYDLFTRRDKVVSVYSQGVNQSSSGTDKCNAIINCHLLTGRIGHPGMGPFSITGQPNAMGGREVGGLANQLAAHMELGSAKHRDRVQRFWNSPVIAQQDGLKAVDLFDAVHDDRIKALWIMATNPAVSLPDAGRVSAAIEKCDFTVISDCVADTDSTRLCDLRLPALTWGERDGTVTNSERCMSRQRPFLAKPGLARPDWWIVTQVARQMGFADLFSYEEPADIFREHAALSGFENDGARQFDIAPLADIDNDGYDDLEPVQWPVRSNGKIGGTARLFGDGQFSTPDGRARFIPITPRPAKSKTSAEHPFVLNTGRVRDHWHTMTRTGVSPRLSSHRSEPYVELHPDDAAAEKLENGALAQVTSPLGTTILRVELSEQQRRGSLFVPMHWSGAYSGQARIGALVAAHCDPVSGQPESKSSVANVAPFQSQWQGFILSRRQLKTDALSYWTRIRDRGLWRYEIAGDFPVADWSDKARGFLGTPDEDNWIDYYDEGARQYRAARFLGGRLDGCIFIAQDNQPASRQWLAGLFQDGELPPKARAALLSGQPPADVEDQGAIVCSCFNVGDKAILKAIGDGCTTPAEIGKCLKAGTNCGSCLPEIKELLSGTQESRDGT